MKRLVLLCSFVVLILVHLMGASTDKTRMNQKIIPCVRANVAYDSKYGKEILVMRETFNKMSKGTESNPDLNCNINIDAPYPWWNINPSYTDLPHWGSHNAFPAGGCLALIGHGYSKVNTPIFDLSTHDAVAIVRFKAKSIQPGTEDCNLCIEGIETNNMGDKWDDISSFNLNNLTTTWKSFEFTFSGCGKSTLFNIYKQFPDDITNWDVLIDDIEIYQVELKIGIPKTLPYTNYKGTSFTLNWESVQGADSYLVDVYTCPEDDPFYGIESYLLKDIEVKSNHFTVNNAQSGKCYYYTIRAKNDNNISIPSRAGRVFDLEAPVLSAESSVLRRGYEAKWSSVPSAERYNYWAYYRDYAEQSGDKTITKEDFEGISNPDGSFSGWTIEHPSHESLPEYDLKDLRQKGWSGTWCAPYTNYLCLDAWHTLAGNGNASLISPELDLSHNGGKVHFTVSLYGSKGKAKNKEGNYYDYQVSAQFVLYNYSEEKKDFIAVKRIDAKDVKAEWGQFDVIFEGASKRSKIEIIANGGPDNLYVDNLKIEQEFKKGEYFDNPFIFARWVEGTSYKGNVPMYLLDKELYHKVSALKIEKEADYYGRYTYKESNFSDYLEIKNPTGVSKPFVNQYRLYINGETMTIISSKMTCVKIYDISGNMVYSNKQIIHNLQLAKGTYIVVIDNNAEKVRL